MLKILIFGFAALAVIYGAILAGDLIKHREEVKRERGNPIAICAATAFIQFLATFGISDFNVSIPIYRGAKWVDDGRLPGTLFTATVIPGAVISMLYISGTAVETATLLSCLLAQSLGVVTGVKIVSGMKGRSIKKGMAIALLASVVVIVIRNFSAGAEGGSLTGFGWGTLGWLIPVFFLFGAVSTLGFGVKALSMALLLTLGLSAQCVLPVVLSSCGFGACCGAVQFVRKGRYQRKIAMLSSVAGIVGVVIGVTLVKGLPTDVLQWIMVCVMLYTAVTMLRPEKEK
ncbi:MAG: sulfite exporter TauE/SafE family protein [Clostridia bacterium]|nr:sulfite exporter TauE/SafE family protein [Clostridia bacterium]MBQ6703665.1 sulfite exporter TauE/SafE family protein [Clostridia bacterium]